MNFSEPGCGAATSSINGSTPLDLAHTLFTDSAHRTRLRDFTNRLTALHDAAYLILLPKATRPEADFRASETTRISTGPQGDALVRATTGLFLHACRRDTIHRGAAAVRAHHLDLYDATGRMLQDLAADQERHLDNMTLLLAAMKAKWKADFISTGSWHRTASRMGTSGIASAHALNDLVGARPPTAPHSRRYLTEIARHWRHWAVEEATAYEEVWSYVAGRALVLE